MQLVNQPFINLNDIDGTPLNNGSIYFGVANQNPETNPIAVYWDRAGTQPAAQPIKTINGYPVRDGIISEIYLPSSCSITVKNKKNLLVFYKPFFDNAASSIGTSAVTGGLWTTVQGFIDYITSTSLGSTVIGWIRSASGAIATTLDKWMNRQTVSVFDFMTDVEIADVQARTKTKDVTGAIRNALASFGVNGGKLRMPKGLYLTTDGIIIPPNVTVVGDGQFGGFGAYDQGCTTIYGNHGADYIFSLVGSVSCSLKDLCLQSGPPGGTYPKTGLMLGRSGTPSCGYHAIKRISVYGSYGVAAIFSIASEDNYWEDINVWLYGGTAKYCFYSSIGNSFPAITTPLYTSSNLTNTFNKFWFTNGGGISDAACIKLDMAEGFAAWSFYGGYCTANSGSYIEIGNGYIDGLSSIGSLTFVGCNGERLAGGDPIYGYKLTASVGCTLPNLNILGGRFDFLAGTNHYLFWQSNNLTLTQPNITMKPPEAFPYAQTVLYRANILGGTINLDRYAAWQTATLTAPWVNSFGAPYPAASFMIDSTGRVFLRGTVTNPGTPGQIVIMILPAAYRPTYTMRIPAMANGAIAMITVAATGNVEIPIGSTVNVDLAGISFDMTAWTLP
ncbi:hypothetical protein UFOVP40_43 [uncultured Caudovirales phage]|uniref:Pectate lyase superfamily protein n=1 Tax=uncultured Caudovirales phage TaxID=2100421 RepID=A0A6J5KQ58_9CAUD|nr:hypothetical protein UFOVP40_43 [uncultured Caudovirales phage]